MKMGVSVSIIIPTYNEAEGIQQLVRYLLCSGDPYTLEVIVSDGGSTDGTQRLAREAGANVIASPVKGRGAQMNAGAAVASGEILYFLHADTYPPADFLVLILKNCTPAKGAGCFRIRFDYDHWFLKLNAWFTRFNANSVRFGDQSLFIRRQYFAQVGCFRTDLQIMEDQEIIYRIRKLTGFTVLPQAVITSARKYRENGIYKLQAIFTILWVLYYCRLPQQRLVQIYNSLISRSKLR